MGKTTTHDDMAHYGSILHPMRTDWLDFLSNQSNDTMSAKLVNDLTKCSHYTTSPGFVKGLRLIWQQLIQGTDG